MVSSERENSQRPIADLGAVVASVGLVAVIVFTPAGDWRPLAIVVGLPFTLLVPGYALVSAVFPRAGETRPGSNTGTSWLGRLGLSVGGSVVAIALVGGVLDFTVWGFGRTAVVIGLCLFTLVATAVAWYRRRRLPADVRAGAGSGAIRERTKSMVAGGGIAGIALTLLVLVAAAGTLGVVAEKTTESGTVTEFYILGETEPGVLVAGSYPANLTVGEPATVGIGVGTDGGEAFEGQVVARLERVTVDDGRAQIRESQRLGAFTIGAAPGETTVRRHTIQPPIAGERLRLTYRLYRTGSESPLRQVHVWVSVAPRS